MSEVITSPDWMTPAEWTASNAAYGDLLTHEWLQGQFCLEKPETGTQEDFDRFGFDYMQAVSSMSQYLLEEHQLALQNVRGKGYRVVPPSEQIDVAKRQARSDLHRAVRRYSQHIQHIRYDELSRDQQKQRDDEAAKLSQLRQMMKRQLNREG